MSDASHTPNLEYDSPDMDALVVRQNENKLAYMGREMNPTEEHLCRIYNSQPPEQRRDFTRGD